MVKRKSRKVIQSAILGMGITCLSAGAAHAANGTWTQILPNAFSLSWATTANWSGGTVASGIGATANLSTANITGGATYDTINLNTPFTIGTLLSGDTNNTANYTIAAGTGGSLTFQVPSGNAAWTQAAFAGTLGDQISAPVLVASNLTLTNSGSNQMILSGASTLNANLTATTNSGTIVISGNVVGTNAQTITKTGTGTVVIGGANGTLASNIISSGNLNLGTASTDTTSTLGTGTVANAGVLRIVRGGTVTLDTSNWSGAGSISNVGGGTLIITGANGETGGISSTGGFVSLAGLTSIGGSGQNLVLSNAVVSLANTPTNTVQSMINRTTATSTGVVALTADNAEALNFASGGTLLTLGAVFTGANGSINFTGSLAPSGGVYRLGGGGGTLNYNGASLTGANAVTVASGTVNLVGANNFTGSLTIGGGSTSVATVGFSSNANLGDPANTIFLNNGYLKYLGSNTLDITSSGHTFVTSRGVGIDTNGNNVTFANALPGSNSTTFAKGGTGTLTYNGSTLSAQNVFLRGGTTVIGNSTVVNSASFDSVGANTGETATLSLVGNASYTITNVAGTGFNVGDVAATGVVNLGLGSTDTPTLNTPALFIGKYNVGSASAVGTFNQSAGTLLTAANYADSIIGGVGATTDATSTGAYNLSGGYASFASSLNVGGFGTGTLTATGGSINMGSYASIGRQAGGKGLIDLSTGSAIVTQHASGIFNYTVPARLVVGNLGLGTVLVGGDSVLNVDYLELGLATGSAGTLVQSGGAINVTSSTVSLTAGTTSFGGIGKGAGSGAFIKSGGLTNFNGNSLSASPYGNATTTFAGEAAALSTFTWSGGEIRNLGRWGTTITQTGSTSVFNVQDYNALGTSSYTINEGLLSISPGRTFQAGTYTMNGSAPVISLDNLGTLSSLSYFVVGQTADATLNVSGGTVLFGQLWLGKANNVTGTINQSAGYVGKNTAAGTVTGDWRIGGFASADTQPLGVGIYNLSGGTFAISGNFQVGAYGTGTLNQTGGTITQTGFTNVARFGGSTGAWNMSAGTYIQSGPVRTIIGQDGGVGTWNISSTAFASVSGIEVGATNSGYGTLNGVGQLYFTSGVVNQSGGTVVISTIKGLAAGTGAGTYALSGGLLNLSGFNIGTNDLTTNFFSGTNSSNGEPIQNFNWTGGEIRNVATFRTSSVSPVLTQTGSTSLLTIAANNATISSGFGTSTSSSADYNVTDGQASIAAGRTLTVTGNMTASGSANVNGLGTISAAALTVNTGARVTSGTLLITADAVQNNGTTTVGAGGSAVNSISTVTGAGTFANAAASTFTTASITQKSLANNGTTTVTSNGTFGGALATDGFVTGAGTLIVSANGTLTATSVRQTSLQVGSGGTVTIAYSAPATPPDADNDANNGNDGHVSILKNLNLGLSGASLIDPVTGLPPTALSTLDLKNNDLIVDSQGGQLTLADGTTQVSAIDYVRAAVAAAYDGASWDLKGITSSTAVGSANKQGLGVITGQEYLDLYQVDPMTPTLFDGVAVTADMVLVKYTWAGDANFDGVEDTSDLSALSGGLGSNPVKDWTTGDFNYDGSVDTADLSVLSGSINNFGHLPEPTGLGAVALGAGALLKRRRRNVH